MDTTPNNSSASSPLSPAQSVPPQIPAPIKKGLPFPLIMLLLVISFLIGLILTTLYFQNQLKALSSKEVSQDSVAAKNEKLIIGTNASFEPMEFLSEQGNLMGYDIDFGQQLGAELNAKVEYKNIPQDSLFAALEKKEVDIIISSVTITDESKQTYDFSDPYLYAGQVFVTNKNISASSSASLKGGKIGVVQGTTSEKEALMYTTDSQVMKYPDVMQATTALKEKKNDAIIVDLTSAKGILKTNSELQILGEPLTNDAYGIVFRKGDARKTQINTALDSLRVKGIITDLKQKWLD